jgi:hypothetical protein
VARRLYAPSFVKFLEEHYGTTLDT